MLAEINVFSCLDLELIDYRENFTRIKLVLHAIHFRAPCLAKEKNVASCTYNVTRDSCHAT